MLAPKVRGARNLDVATRVDALDWFVLCSSAVAVLGPGGQANYAAANAYLDALAAARRREGLPACSIGWGPWAEVGLAAADEGRGARLAEKGLGGLGTREALASFERALDTARDHVLVMRLDAPRWTQREPSSAVLLAELVGPGATGSTAPGPALREQLGAVASPARRRVVLEDAVRAELAPVLRTTADAIGRERDVRAMGLDSLMSLELRNRLEVVTGLTLPATTAFNHPTVAALATLIADRLGVSLVADAPASELPAGAGGAADPVTVAAVDVGASEHELAALLADELAAVERLLDGEGGTP